LGVGGCYSEVCGNWEAGAFGVEVDDEHWGSGRSAEVELAKLEGCLLGIDVLGRGKLHLDVSKDSSFARGSLKAQRHLKLNSDDSALRAPGNLMLRILDVFSAVFNHRRELCVQDKLRLRLGLFIVLLAPNPRQQPLMFDAHLIIVGTFLLLCGGPF
jgi:hypothetical protein